MTTTNQTLVELTEVKCYKVKSLTTGKDLPMMMVASEWNGLQELRTIAKNPTQLLIVATPDAGGFAGAMRGLLGNPTTKAVVLKGSPDLLAMLQDPPAASAPQDQATATGPEDRTP